MDAGSRRFGVPYRGQQRHRQHDRGRAGGAEAPEGHATDYLPADEIRKTQRHFFTFAPLAQLLPVRVVAGTVLGPDELRPLRELDSDLPRVLEKLPGLLLAGRNLDAAEAGVRV